MIVQRIKAFDVSETHEVGSEVKSITGPVEYEIYTASGNFCKGVIYKQWADDVPVDIVDRLELELRCADACEQYILEVFKGL